MSDWQRVTVRLVIEQEFDVPAHLKGQALRDFVTDHISIRFHSENEEKVVPVGSFDEQRHIIPER